MHILTYGGRSSADFGVIISGESTWRKPSPKTERLSIPGRNGDIVTFTGSYENVDISYRCGIGRHFDEKYTAFINYLLSVRGYARLEDSYHPDVYRLAVFDATDDPLPGTLYRSGEFEVNFSCKPQSFLKSGERAVTFSANGTIYNPTLYASKPLLRVFGAGEFTIGGDTVTITAADTYTDLDCELEDAYKGTTNCNGNVILSGDHFPTIPAGTQGVTLGSGITKIEIIPRWWRL